MAIRSNAQSRNSGHYDARHDARAATSRSHDARWTECTTSRTGRTSRRSRTKARVRISPFFVARIARKSLTARATRRCQESQSNQKQARANGGQPERPQSVRKSEWPVWTRRGGTHEAFGFVCLLCVYVRVRGAAASKCKLYTFRCLWPSLVGG